MLNRYFIRPTTVDRIRACWIGEAIEGYVVWLTERKYAARNVSFRVPVLVRFGEFAKRSGATNLHELPTYVEPFIEDWLNHRKQECLESQRSIAAREVRNPIRQLLQLILPHHGSETGSMPDPFVDVAPGFFDFLRRDRGLREATIVQYRHYLQRLQSYLQRVDRPLLPNLPPTVISALITESGASLDKRSVQSLCSILKVFFRYLYRVGLMTRDLCKVIESPRRYGLSTLPRSIAWSDVEQMLLKVDRRSVVGKRDYAILLLLVTYGLRAREVGALTLDDIDWKHDRLNIRARKAGHSTAYPLAPIVGEALLDYLKQGRPETIERALFIGAYAPYTPLSRVAVSMRAKCYLRKAGINVSRPGSHTLRHTCVQRLVDSGFSLKTIGDFVGHRTPDATRIYAKVNIEALRKVALGNGEEARMKSTPKGPLADGIELYLAHKRSLGKQLAKVGPMLHLLDRYLVAQGIMELRQITPVHLEEFVASRPRHSPRSYNGLIGTLRGLFDWMVVQEELSESPLRCEVRRTTQTRRPFLFNLDQARNLLEAAAQLPSNPRALHRGETYKMIFALLYGLGLRVGEVARLCRKDVDFDSQLLMIHQTKFGKDRLVPFGPRMAQTIKAFLEHEESRYGPIAPDCPVFSFAKRKRTPIGTNTISSTFHNLLPALHLTVPSGVAAPHLHCLRHSFAVGTLLRWYQEGVDPMSRLFDLSTFLGHVSPSSTAVYLTITTELLECASDRFAQFASNSRKGCMR